METNKPFDALIIGSGIGGTSTGILLSLLGFRTAVVEKNPLPGGLMRSYRRQGQECPVGVHYFGSFGEGEPLRRMCDALGVTGKMAVERMGREGPIDRYCFDDFSFDLPEGLDNLSAALVQAFPEDGKRIEAIAKHLRALREIQNRFDFFSASPPFPDMDLFSSVEEHLTGLGCSPRLRSVLGVASRWMGMSDAQCPVLYHHLALVSYLQSSWRPRGSGSALAEAFADRFRELGGLFLCGDPVEEILLAGREVQGVRLASRGIVPALRIVAAVHPKTALAMLPEGALPPRHVRRIARLAETEGLFLLHAALSATRHPPLSHNLYRLKADGSGAIRDGVFYQLRPGQGGKNLLTIIAKSPFSEWQRWEHTITGRRGEAYAEQKARRVERLLQEAGEVLGPLEGAEILDACTPLSLRDWVNSPHGAPYGIMRSAQQLAREGALHRPLAGGLYLAGQSALSPGVLGTVMASFHAVRQMVGQERFSREVLARL